MSEAKKRNYYSPAFKAKVGLEAVRGVKTINEIGQEYGVHPGKMGKMWDRPLFFMRLKSKLISLGLIPRPLGRIVT
ncbi:hypothetical protein FACS1894158_01080 [Betaproteobacteria bacterium]|nr:hypothetical protein FACS1894158_01080 [Betaproteobacteria bacterium]